MACSEDIDVISTTDDGNNNECATKNEELHVKDVLELNGNANGGNSESALNTSAKRKLPSWMLSANSSNSAKSAENQQQKTSDEEKMHDGDSEESTQSKRRKTTDEETGEERVSEGNTSQNDTNQAAAIVIKTEPAESSDVQSLNRMDEPESSDTPAAASPQSNTEVKSEPAESKPNVGEASTSINCTVKDIKPAIKIEKADASSTSRESCKYGIRCYRRNAMHRIEEAHPGDHDYKRPSYPPPPDGTPNCPYGNSCYRRNPVHFQQFSHPADTDFEQNYRRYRLRQRRQQQRNDNQNDNDHSGSDLDEYDLDDPFIDDDSDLDYVPSDDGNDSENLV